MLHTILIIDDSETDRAIYKRFLRQDELQSYQLVECETGEKALSWCQKNRADVILLDYQLTGIDGLEFLRQLRQQQPNEILPVIFLTGLGNIAVAVEAIKLGAQDYLEKAQITKESLPQLVRSVLQQVQLQQKLSRQQAQNQIINEMALRMRQSLDSQSVLDRATQDIRQFLQVDRVLVYQFPPDWSGLIVSESVVSDCLSILRQQIEDTCFQQGAGASYRQGHIWAMPNIEQADLTDCHRELLQRFSVKANLVVPILQNVPAQTDPQSLPSLWGLLIAHHCSEPHEWQEEEITCLEQIAVHLSIAVQQTSLYEQVQTELAERKQAELALKQSEEKLRLMIEYSPVGLAMFDREMRYLMVSQRWIDDHDPHSRTIEDYLGRSHYEIYPHLPERLRQAHQRGLTGGIEEGNEDLIIREDGLHQWFEWKLRPWYTTDSEIGGIVIFSEEITQRKQAEIALAGSKARLKLAQSASKSGVWDWDLVTNTLFWSSEYYSLYELDPSVEPNYDNWLSCIHPDDHERINQEMLQALEDGSEVKVEFRVIRSDGMRWFAGVGQIFRDAVGEAVRLIGITIDMTEMKQIQTALQQSNEQLQTINQELERSNQVKEAFLRMMSHELRTPLNPILGMSEALEEEVFGSLNDRQKQSISMIYTHGRHLLTLINKILDIVNLEARQVKLTCYPVLVKDLCKASLAVISTQAADKLIQLQTYIAPEISVIQVDGEQVKQILTQLLENAVKFTPKGGTVTLAVQLSSMESNSNSAAIPCVQFSVKDTGIGIAPENLPHLFKLFTQVDDRLNRNYEGSGIGLALVHRLVELHEGYITVESQLEQGSCFTVSLPYQCDSNRRFCQDKCQFMPARQS